MRLLIPLSAALLCWTLTARGADNAEAMRHAQRSYELSKSGQLDQAAAEMKAAIDAAPGNPLFHTALGGILGRQGKLADAKACFAKAVDLDGHNPRFRLQLAVKQWETGELEASRDNLLVVLGHNAADPEALRLLEAVSLDWGAVLAHQGRWKAGLALAKDTTTRFPETSSAWQMRGLFEARNQQNMAATESYGRALKLDAECVDCATGLGMAQAAAGLSAEATNTFARATDRWPKHAVLRQAYGAHLLHQADVDPAAQRAGVEQLRKALELDPQLVEARYQLGNVALEAGDVASALELLQAAVADSGAASPAKLHYALARAWRRAGDEGKAAEAMRRFQERKVGEQP